MEHVEATTRKEIRRARRTAMRAAMLYSCVLEEWMIGYVTPQVVLDDLYEEMSRAQAVVEQHRRRTEGH